MSELADRSQREIIRTDLDHNVVVEAAAGTGKTTELVGRIVAVLAAGRASVDRLVAVTFTEKAAGELKLRLRAGLEKARHAAPEETASRERLEAALARLEEARVSTIHGFCADLLRERPVEALVDPEFRVLTEGEAERLYQDAFARWLHEHLEDPPEGVRRSLRRASNTGEGGRAERLRRAGWTLASWRDFPTPWRRDAFDRHAAIDTVVERLRDFAALTRRAASPDRDNLYKDTGKVRALCDGLARSETVRERDYDGLEAALVELAADRDFRRPRKGYGFYAKEVQRSAVLSAHAEVRAELEEFARAADADLAAALHGELLETVRRYDALKRRSGVLDFVDLLVRARDLIRDSAAVRAEFQGRFTHLFVDEFQDTDPLQAEILLLLSASEPAVTSWREVDPVPGKLFVVGDPKQSIYRFRRADVGTYLEVTRLLAERGARTVCLTTSFRALPGLQRMVNAAFAARMDGDEAALQAAYVPLTSYRESAGDQPPVVALPVPRPYGRTAVTQTAIEASLPHAVAAFVEWLLAESRWKVSERDRPGERVDVAARHVCLLFRRFDSFFSGDMTRGYVKALEARGIAHLLVGGKSFHAREEVETMRAALSAIEWPDDELSVFATLRGSLFSIGDEELLRWRHQFRHFHPFRSPREKVPDDLVPIARSLDVLAKLHRGRNRRTVAETIARLLETTRAHAGFALRPSGEQALANVLHIAELARAYEASGGISFRTFVERLTDDAEHGRTAEAPILEEGSDGVRIMTAHKAKGLEFPVVILADITAKSAGPAARFIDPVRGLCALRITGWVPAELREHEAEEEKRDVAEGLRVAYVAATRARDLLVVPVVGDEPFAAGWVSCLNDALYPPKQDRRASRPVPGCPPFGADSTLERPPELAFDNVSGVKPGLHAFGTGDAAYDVVWWDPKTLVLDAEARFGIRQRELLDKGVAREIVEADLRTYGDWLASRDAAVEQGARKSLTARTATAHAAIAEDAAAGVAVAAADRESGRPAGPRFGALVHAALAAVPLAARDPDVANVVRQQARILGATDAEIEAAVRAVGGALAHPLLRRAAAAFAEGCCRRETPLTLGLADGTLIEGVVDLAFLESGAWTVVDFKTDGEIERGLAVYRRQVALYAQAISAATGQPASAVLLQV